MTVIKAAAVQPRRVKGRSKSKGDRSTFIGVQPPTTIVTFKQVSVHANSHNAG